MKTLLTPTQLIAVEVPEKSNRISKGLNECHLTFYDVENFTVWDIGMDFLIIGTVDKGVIDFDCESFLPISPNHIEKHFMSFNHDGLYKNKNKAFLSLLTSHSLSLDKKYLIIKPKN